MTANKAAAEIRHKILRKMKQLKRDHPSMNYRWPLLEEYIRNMAKRASAKKGGLGRK